MGDKENHKEEEEEHVLMQENSLECGTRGIALSKGATQVETSSALLWDSLLFQLNSEPLLEETQITSESGNNMGGYRHLSNRRWIKQVNSFRRFK